MRLVLNQFEKGGLAQEVCERMFGTGFCLPSQAPSLASLHESEAFSVGFSSGLDSSGRATTSVLDWQRSAKRMNKRMRIVNHKRRKS